MADTEKHNNEQELQRWARIADCRRHTTIPDVDAEWERFRDKHIDTDKGQRVRIMHLWLSALAGAAAMLVGVILTTFIHKMPADGDDIASDLFVMHHSEGPQLVTLSTGTQIVDVSSRDSLDYQRKSSGAKDISHKTYETQSLTTPRGMDFKLTLQDGTEVWLNAESTIDFPASFVSSNVRQVSLRGEAYFKVAHNESKPFIVHIGDKEVKVLGTAFNVRYYSSVPSLVALVEGSIELSGQGESQMLKPGQGAIWNEDGQLDVKDIDIYAVTQWVDGLFYFDEQPLSDVLIEVARWYNVGIRFANRQHAKCKVHFSASRTDSLQQLLTDLQMVCGFKISLEDNNIVVY